MAEQDESLKVEFMVVAEEVMAVIRELHEHGGIDDVFGRLPDKA